MLTKIGMTVIALLVASPAGAACFGSSTFSSCSDNYGNQYSVQRFGNQTTVTGSNPYTGSNWSQHSTTLGNSTFTNGMTNGRSWNETETQFGGVRSTFGTNSLGQPFSHTCTAYGCD